MFIFFAYVLRT